MKRILLLLGAVVFWVGAQGQLTAPFTESFDNTSIPTGWTNTSSSTSTNANWKFSGTPGNPSMSGSAYNPPVILDHTGNSGSIAWSDGSSPAVADCGLLTDSIDPSSLTSLFLEFWIYSNNVTNAGDNNTIYVNFYDGTQWNDSIWGYAGDGVNWQYVGIDLSTFTTSGNILFEFVVDQTTAGTAFYNDILLDDISVKNVPPCPLPLNFAASNITATTADVSWTAVSAASSYEVISGVEGFDPATAGTSQTTTTTSATVTGLSGATTYDMYLIADCGSANGISDTAGPVKVTTLCVPFTAPYSTNFDSDQDGQVAQCWEQYNSYNTSAYARVENLGTPRSGTQQLALYSWLGFSANDTLLAISPEFSDLTGGDKQIRFHAKTSNVNDTLLLMSMDNSTSSANVTVLDTIVFSATNVYQEIIFPMTTANGYNGTDTYVGLAMSLGGAATFSYIYIDDFFYEVIPTCPKVSNISLTAATSSSASFSFTTSGTAAQYELGLTGFAQGTNTAAIQSTGGNPFSVSGLQPGTTYDIYVRNDCGGGDTSVWEGPVTFTTAFVPPYLEDFSAGIPASWSSSRGLIANPTVFSGTGAWFEDGFGNVGTTGAARLNIYSTFPADWLFGENVDLGNGTIDYQLEFDASVVAWNTSNQGTLGTDDSLKVVLSYDGGTTWNDSNTIFVLTSSDVVAATGSHYVVSLAGITGGVQFAFYGESTQFNADNDVFIDNVQIREVPSCPQPLMLSSTTLGSDSSLTTWNAGSALTLKTFVEYGISGFTPQSGAAVGIVSVTDTFAGIGGLLPATTYDFYVYDSCAVGLSPVTGPVSITTNCLPTTITQYESFDTWPIACWDNVGSFGWTEYVGTAGDNYAEADFWGNQTGEAIFNTQPVILNQYAQVSFDWSHLYNATYPDDQLLIMIRKVSQTAWDTILNLQGPNNFNEPTSTSFQGPGNWVTENIILDTNTYGLGDTVQIQLRANTDWGPDLYINDFYVEPLPACPTPFNLTATNLTATSADLNATTYFGTSFDIEWGPTGFIQGTGTGTLVTGIGSLPYSLTGLSPNTFYDYYLRVNCGSNLTSWVGPFTFKTPCTAALAGAYTIGGAAGANNFTTLDSAISVLNGCGVSGPVTFTLSGGASYAQANIGEVVGVSATNTVTFNGTLANPDTIAGLELDGSDWITFNDLYFRRLSGFNVWLHNEANNNAFNGCTFESDQSSTSSANSNIALTGTSTSFFSGANNANNLTVDNNTFIGGYAALHSYGTAGDKPSGIIFTNNTIVNPYTYGVYVFQTDSAEIRNNVSNSLRSTFGYNYFVSSSSSSEVTGNVGYGASYGLSAANINVGTPNSRRMLIANNMFSGTTYALYVQSGERFDVYHNTAIGNIGGYFGSFFGMPTDLDIRNNIFGATGTQQAFFANNALSASSTLDYNAYDTTAGGSVANYNGTVYSNLAAWNTAVTGLNASSVEGSVGVVGATDYHLLGGLANDQGDNTVGILVDIDGDVRPAAGSTIVDMGADEYTPVTEDIGINAAEFDRNSPCLTSNDTIVVTIQNTLGATKNFATTNLTIGYDVTGPINSSGTFTLNSGTLALNASLDVRISGIDMSATGTYAITQAYIAPNTDNLTAVNDTLYGGGTSFVVDVFDARPDTLVVVSSATDTVNLEARSPLFGGGGFHITEICQFRGSGNGNPAGGWPSYMSSGVDDYMEITGIPNSDLGGVVFEQYTTAGLARTYTFPAGTVLSPNGTCILMTGETAKPSEPQNFLYDARGTSTQTWSSGVASGHILRDGSGNIIDAVTYGGFSFPSTAGVTAADWSGTSLSGSGSNGLRLEGPDLNSPTGWISCTVAGGGQQDPNSVNNMVVVPAPVSISGFTWELNGSTYAGVPDTIVTNFTSSGVFNYIATYNSACGLLQDTVTIVVNLGCPAPNSFNATVNSCDDVDFDWVGAGDSSLVYVVPAGGTPTGAGNIVINDSTFNYTAGAPNTSYDVYIANICGGDTTALSGPFAFSITNEGAPTASFTTSGVGLTLTFDATASVGSGLSYAWDFGDGNTGTGVTATNTYASGGSYSITLTVTNACGSDDTIITVGDVSVLENELSNSLALYPNPSDKEVHVSFTASGERTAQIVVMEMGGKVVMRQTVNTVGGEYSGVLDIASFARGVYTVEITSGELIGTTRLIKQ